MERQYQLHFYDKDAKNEFDHKIMLEKCMLI